MSSPDVVKFSAEGVLCEFKESHDGHAKLGVVLYRTTRTGKAVRYELQIRVERSSLGCIHAALQRFAQREKAAAAEVARMLGVS